MRLAIEQSVSAKARLAVFETVVTDDRQNIEIDPARERHTMLRNIDSFLRRIETDRLLYIQFDRAPVKLSPGYSESIGKTAFEGGSCLGAA
jgi:predicted anti-sigma-YlaC factor YlaD